MRLVCLFLEAASVVSGTVSGGIRMTNDEVELGTVNSGWLVVTNRLFKAARGCQKL